MACLVKGTSIGIGTGKPNIYSKESVSVSVSKSDIWCITIGDFSLLVLLGPVSAPWSWLAPESSAAV